MTLTIGGVGIGGDNPCRFVAEVSNAHNGDLKRAHRLLDAIATTGAEFVKFQAYTPQELVDLRGDGPAPAQWGEQGWTMRALYEKAQTPLVWLPELFQHARDIGLVPFSSVFGWDSLMALRAVANPCYKIAALDNTHEWLITACKATTMPVLASTSEQGLGAHRRFGRCRPDGLLYAPPGYPTPAVDVRLPHHLPMHGFVGCSLHCLDPRLPIAAVARGAKLIEMHVQLDDCPSALEENVSLRVSEFRRMVEDIRATEGMLA